MKVAFSQVAWAQLLDWHATDPDIFRRILALIGDACRHPFAGLGKPEPLRGDFAGVWSRRITAEHRLVCLVSGSGAEQTLGIAQCRYHYRKR